MSKISKHPIGSFSIRTIEMMESPAFKALSRAARQALDRIEIEHAHHGGKDNGRLPVTYIQFIEYGLHHNAIAPAIRELVALGLVEVTKQGRAGNAEWRRPTLFRLTYRNTFDLKATNEWRQITKNDAEMVANNARKNRRNQRKIHTTLSAVSTPEKRTETWYGKRTIKSKNAQKSHSTETGSTSRLTLHLVGLAPPGAPNPANAPHSPPDVTASHPDADPWADLNIPPFLRRGG